MTSKQYIKELKLRELKIEELRRKSEGLNIEIEKLFRKTLSMSDKLTRQILPFHKKMYKMDKGYREMIERIERDFGDFCNLVEKE